MANLSQRLREANEALIEANQELAQMPLLKHRLAEMYNQHAALEGQLNDPTRFPQLAGNGTVAKDQPRPEDAALNVTAGVVRTRRRELLGALALAGLLILVAALVYGEHAREGGWVGDAWATRAWYSLYPHTDFFATVGHFLDLNSMNARPANAVYRVALNGWFGADTQAWYTWQIASCVGMSLAIYALLREIGLSYLDAAAVALLLALFRRRHPSGSGRRSSTPPWPSLLERSASCWPCGPLRRPADIGWCCTEVRSSSSCSACFFTRSACRCSSPPFSSTRGGPRGGRRSGAGYSTAPSCCPWLS